MSAAASAVINSLRHNGLKHAWQPSKYAARHNTSTPTLRHPTASGDAQKPSPRTRPLFTCMFERHPRAVNVTTLNPTRIHAEDRMHPFHIKVNRRLETFDPNKLYWRVHVPIDVSRKAAIRRWAMKRVREAVRLELMGRGFKWDGSSGNGTSRNLRGALLIILPKDPMRALAIGYEEVESNVRRLMGKVVAAQLESKNNLGSSELLRL